MSKVISTYSLAVNLVEVYHNEGSFGLVLDEAFAVENGLQHLVNDGYITLNINKRSAKYFDLIIDTNDGICDLFTDLTFSGVPYELHIDFKHIKSVILHVREIDGELKYCGKDSATDIVVYDMVTEHITSRSITNARGMFSGCTTPNGDMSNDPEPTKVENVNGNVITVNFGKGK